MSIVNKDFNRYFYSILKARFLAQTSLFLLRHIHESQYSIISVLVLKNFYNETDLKVEW